MRSMGKANDDITESSPQLDLYVGQLLLQLPRLISLV
jgi:hypothetical protein